MSQNLSFKQSITLGHTMLQESDIVLWSQCDHNHSYNKDDRSLSSRLEGDIISQYMPKASKMHLDWLPKFKDIVQSLFSMCLFGVRSLGSHTTIHCSMYKHASVNLLFSFITHAYIWLVCGFNRINKQTTNDTRVKEIGLSLQFYCLHYTQ